MGFQVDWATHRFWFWLKEIAIWDLRLTQKEEKEREKERKKKEKKKKKRKKKEKTKLWDEWITQQARKTLSFLYKAYYAKHWGCFAS